MISSILCFSSHGHIPKTNTMATNPFACSVLIEMANRRDEKKLRKAIMPLMTWIDPCLKLIQVSKTSGQNHNSNRFNSEPTISPPTLNTQKRRLTHTFRIPCPAVSIMLFLQENGVLGSRELQKSFNQSPWRLHHRIELVNVHCPDRALADQRFYQAHTDTPLWAVSPIDAGREHLRINIFVRNFPAMIEFYRIITGVEMETNKDNFCWFRLYSQPGLEIRLSLKCVDNVDPYPLETVQLLFEVNNVRHIKTALGVELKFIGSGCYTMTDPDGNVVVLHTSENTVCPLFNVRYKEQPVCRRNHPKEFRNDFTTKMSPLTDSSSLKFNTLPRNFSYFKKNASTSNDSGLFTGSESSHADDLYSPVFSKDPTSWNSLQRFTKCKKEMTSSSEEIFNCHPSKQNTVQRHNSLHISFRNNNGHDETDKDDFCEQMNFPKRRQDRSKSTLGTPSTEEEPRLSTALRRSHSALIDFNKYVIKQNAIRVNLKTPIVSEEIFV